MIKGVIFDCFGVLYRGAFQTLIDLAPDDLKSSIHDLHRAKDRGYITFDEFLSQVGDSIGKSAQEVRAIIDKQQVLNAELMDYMANLRRSKKVALLSNIDESTYQVMFGSKSEDLFDAAVLSFSEGIAKPDPQIFITTAERLGLRAEECIMVDDLPDNCSGAEAVGMRSVLHVDNASTIRKVNEMIEVH
ncbi:MAG: HAD family phosphatase [Candidatus Saccharimonas sp.]